MIKAFECIIVGAGPSGLLQALSLCKNNIKNICIIELNDKTYHKPCAGLLSLKTYKNFKKLGMDIEKDLNYYREQDVSVFNNGKYIFKTNIHTEDDFIFASFKKPDRETLDDYLKEKVENLGIKIFYNTKIEYVNIKNRELFTSEGIFKCKTLIFADGTNGYSKIFNKVKSKNIAIEAILKLDKKTEKFVQVYFGELDQGYAWIGNTGSYVTIGFTAIYNKNKDYIKKLIEFGKEHGYSIKKEDVKGAFFPNGLNKNVVFDNIYIVGDAGGMTDPISAEGLYYASEMAIILGESIKNNNLKMYLKGIKPHKKIIRRHRLFKNFFYSKFGRFIMFDVISKTFNNFVNIVFFSYGIRDKNRTIKDTYKGFMECRKIIKQQEKNMNEVQR